MAHHTHDKRNLVQHLLLLFCRSLAWTEYAMRPTGLRDGPDDCTRQYFGVPRQNSGVTR
jgi:hypothetical protein